MPYLSHNYRYIPRSRHKNLVEMTIFISASAVAVFATLFALGWMSAARADSQQSLAVHTVQAD